MSEVTCTVQVTLFTKEQIEFLRHVGVEVKLVNGGANQAVYNTRADLAEDELSRLRTGLDELLSSCGR